jgi:DNA-binding NtrC family response regulator
VTDKSQKQSTGRVLVVDDHPQSRGSICEILTHVGHRVEGVSSAIEGLARLGVESFDLIITDLQMPGMSGLEFIRELTKRRHGAQIVMVTAYASVSTAVDAMRHGAFDYIEKPFNVDALEDLVDRALAHGRLIDAAAPSRTGGTGDEPVMMQGSSRKMQALRDRIAQVAPTTETVLITGESGTGKELVARAIHAQSRRAASPLVSLNCPVLSDHLMESELFGHEKGAFTGADAARTGRFELADGGTILLDEVSEIGLPLQAKLLRVLQERTFERVGSSKTQRLDVRVLASSNRDLPAEAKAGRFREDLYYRLAVVPLAVPPLRERLEDVAELAHHFLERAAGRLQRDPCQLDAAARDLLSHYQWPGNVRELENIITRASVLCSSGSIGVGDIRPWLIDGKSQADESHGALPVGTRLDEMERALIEATLDHYSGHRARTAEALGIGIRTLSGKLRGYGYAPREKSFSRAI